jgi:3-isopropylmalate dehydrogenase
MEGDGVGKEVVAAAMEVMSAVERRFGISFSLEDAPAGDEAKRRNGSALPSSSVKAVEEADATLKGPLGWSAKDVIVRLRRDLELFANVRPAKTLYRRRDSDPPVDLVIVRENTEDLYSGIEFELGDGAVAMKVITRQATARIAEYAVSIALKRNKSRKITCVHKANVLEKTDGLFSAVSRELISRYPAVRFEEMLVDAAAMNLIRNPLGFDVILAPNLYGDILSDEAAQIAGGIGFAPSANIGQEHAIFEPVHGAAFDIAGRGTVNPAGMILSAAMMLRYLGETHGSGECSDAAAAVEKGVENALSSGVVTADSGGHAGTSDFGRYVSRSITGR